MATIGYGGYPPRPRGFFPLERDRFDVSRMQPEHFAVFDGVRRRFDQPFAGITTDGTVRPGLFDLAGTGLDTGPMVRAARDLLAVLGAEERRAGRFPVDGDRWRRWTNAFPVWEPHGLLLEDLETAQREAVMALVAASLSARGAEDTRTAMRLNAVLGEVVQDYPGTLREWMYRFSLLGEPSAEEPWGWQLVGHHLDLHCVVVGSQMVLTPAFVGAEPRVADRGPYAGLRLFDAEMAAGRALVQALDDQQRQRATLAPSMWSADLPPHLNHRTEGRMRSVVGGDNAVLPYEGLPAEAMTDAQRGLVRDLIDCYVGWLPGPAAAARRAEIERHLPDTHLAWIGDVEDGPFYYKLHSPVLLVELDCHRGVFLANDEPETFHVHTVVRTPNGGDYGRDLLRRHLATSAHGAPAVEDVSPGRR